MIEEARKDGVRSDKLLGWQDLAAIIERLEREGVPQIGPHEAQELRIFFHGRAAVLAEGTGADLEAAGEVGAASTRPTQPPTADDAAETDATPTYPKMAATKDGKNEPTTETKSGGTHSTWQTMAEIEGQVKKLAPTDYSILLLGETGTGKEYLAMRIHSESQRKTAPFVAVNCPSLPKDRIDAELYGYARGAFTGADKPYVGRIREAAGGTVFLDEIGDLPPECWGNLLRFLQSREISPLRDKAETVNVRVLAATNKPGRVPPEGLHRFDHQLCLPPLRERRKDILEIAEGFFESAKSKNNRASLRFAQAEREKLASADYDWPGNIRQLEKATQRAVLLHATGRDVTAQEILDAAKAVANLA
jgi:transcriptional regulator with GAF, ATPase, and Fis domain